MDLSKAFDTLDHDILIGKLKHYGLNDMPWTLYTCSYLSNREQFVDFCGTESTRALIKTGVPQGSILGPLLFIIYINDLYRASDIFNSIIFADDTTLESELNKFGSETRPEELNLNINLEISKISDWLRANKLSLNIAKTKYVIFERPGSRQIDIRLTIHQPPTERAEVFNFLGLPVYS
jgi:hypothetical protein